MAVVLCSDVLRIADFCVCCRQLRENDRMHAFDLQFVSIDHLSHVEPNDIARKRNVVSTSRLCPPVQFTFDLPSGLI